MSNLEMHSAVRLQKFSVHLTRVKPKIPAANTNSVVVGNIHCPGCSLSFTNEEKCVEHLLQQCLKIRTYEGSEEYRSKVIKWISQYFHGCYHKMLEDSCNKDTKNTTNDETISDVKVKRPHLEIKLHEIGRDLQCPVCVGYFYPAKACCKHLFENCLFTDKLKNAIPIRKWLSQYLWYNNKKATIDVNVNVTPAPTKEVACKYCKIQIDDKNSLMTHCQECHRQECPTEGPTCIFCNFKALSSEKLTNHLITKHMRCGCGFKPSSFNMLNDHFGYCLKRSEAVCPICKQVNVDSFQGEAYFRDHLLNCNRPVVLNLQIGDLYFECDVCRLPVLKCDSDAHLAHHFQFPDFSARRQKRIFVNLNELREALPCPDFHKLQSLFE